MLIITNIFRSFINISDVWFYFANRELHIGAVLINIDLFTFNYRKFSGTV